jgi:hypothetical protein
MYPPVQPHALAAHPDAMFHPAAVHAHALAAHALATHRLHSVATGGVHATRLSPGMDNIRRHRPEKQTGSHGRNKQARSDTHYEQLLSALRPLPVIIIPKRPPNRPPPGQDERDEPS